MKSRLPSSVQQFRVFFDEIDETRFLLSMFIYIFSETKGFVAILFEALKNKVYLKSNASNPAVKVPENLNNSVTTKEESESATPLLQVQHAVAPSSQKTLPKAEQKV